MVGHTLSDRDKVCPGKQGCGKGGKEGDKMSERAVRMTLIVVDLLAALSAFVGAVGLVAGFMNIPSSVLATTPFADFTIPALLLGIVVGGSALAAALIAWFGPRRLTVFGSWRFDAVAAAAAGCIMVGWMVIELAMIGLGTPVQVVYLVVGLVMIALAATLQLTEGRAESPRRSAIGLHRPA